jgi:Na+-transporting NADH:ubiquinone oxidoreductase subunit NqrE
MKLNFYLRLCTHFLVAVIFAFILASLLHSQFVMAELTSVGVEILFNDRLSMSLDDLLGLYQTYGVVIAVSFLIAFMVSSLLVKRVKFSPYILYSLAGGIGFAVALLAMHPILEITLLAGARSPFGFICQCLAGAMGGGLFVLLRSKDHIPVN